MENRGEAEVYKCKKIVASALILTKNLQKNLGFE
jgi:hypothetical protein